MQVILNLNCLESVVVFRSMPENAILDACKCAMATQPVAKRLTASWLSFPESMLLHLHPTHTHTCRHVHTHIHSHIHTRTHTQTHTQTHTHTHTNTQTHTDTFTHTQTHTHTLAHKHEHTQCTYTHTPLCTASCHTRTPRSPISGTEQQSPHESHCCTPQGPCTAYESKHVTPT